ncbi:hypothetical protein [Sinomicrobium weinanense]|uniref:Uncharacterized protein n=1 Tax=Sinomicrobium weinanense TaxID=2842200 RepID=A0A926Q4L9_9FLAO|nr:hypothetical protein [Sinomicrobium weinanense]MBC9797035.1 hypothetical protein [Sinomicrobium weinanense]MBU3122030.1 hypothetical protein [Sinomicrobium weinanense]
MKNSGITLGLCFVFSVLAVVILYALSDKLTHKHNSFNRFFPPHPVIPVKEIDLNYNSYYFAGTDRDKVYLSNLTAPLHVLEVDLPSLDTIHITIQVENPKAITFSRNTRVSVLPPYFYISDGIAPGLLRGRLGAWHARRFMYDSAYFSDATPIGPKSFILKTMSSTTREYVLGKETDKVPHVKLVPGLLEKQIDGIFCTDGMLHYNKDLSRLIYLYHYRNQYMVMDTSLNLLSYGKTIDTNSRAKIKTASIPSQYSTTLSAPGFMVNKDSYTSGELLFVHSDLMAKNESLETFNKTSVIDVYNIQDHTYKFSFYIYPYEEFKLNQFAVTDRHLIAIHHRHLLVYELHPKWFPDLQSQSAEVHLSGTHNNKKKDILSR